MTRFSTNNLIYREEVALRDLSSIEPVDNLTVVMDDELPTNGMTGTDSNLTKDSGQSRIVEPIRAPLSVIDTVQPPACRTNSEQEIQVPLPDLNLQDVTVPLHATLNNSNSLRRPEKCRKFAATRLHQCFPTAVASQNPIEFCEQNINEEEETTPNQSFNIVSDALLEEARHYAASLSQDPPKALDLLAKLQESAASVQSALGKNVLVHLVLEAPTPGDHNCQRFRHVVPIFSKTLLPSFCVDVLGSAVVVSCLIEALAIADQVARNDRNARIPVHNYNKLVNFTAKLPRWFPGKPTDNICVSSNDYQTLSLYSSLDNSKSARAKSINELKK